MELFSLSGSNDYNIHLHLPEYKSDKNQTNEIECVKRWYKNPNHKDLIF